MALMTQDKSILELLTKLGMPKGCTNAIIDFKPNSAVTITFTKFVTQDDAEMLTLFLEDKQTTEAPDGCRQTKKT